MIINKIHIEGIKGIESQDFDLRLIPNKPVLLVAPNGYGKTSFATAFNSLKRSKLDVADENKHMNSDSINQILSIRDDAGNTYLADTSQNTISDVFSIFVINNQLKSTHTSRRISGYNAVSSSIGIEPIVLINSIPEKKVFSYSFRETQSKFTGSSRKLLFNIGSMLKEPTFVSLLNQLKGDFDKLNQVRISKKIDDFVAEINAVTGTKNQLIARNFDTSTIDDISSIFNIAKELERSLSLSKIESIINAFQLKEVYNENRSDFSKIIKYYTYLGKEADINEMLSFFNCTWKDIKAVKKDGALQIIFPQANQISNGERDALCFIGKLLEANSKMKKNKGILIVDEVFDYLDDANLISVQYFLNKFIEQFKSQEKELFPVILTHLDPMYFRTYSFSTKNVEYLKRVAQVTNKFNVNNLLKDRDNCKAADRGTYELISNNYLHYNEDTESAESYLSAIRVDDDIKRAKEFRDIAFAELERYRSGQSYDVALVCCGLRLYIEKCAYDQLDPTKQATFLTQKNKTIDKIAYAKEQNANIPEVHFLLSIIYNEAMHLDPQCKKLHPISYKLKNKVIKNMICEA